MNKTFAWMMAAIGIIALVAVIFFAVILLQNDKEIVFNFISEDGRIDCSKLCPDKKIDSNYFNCLNNCNKALSQTYMDGWIDGRHCGTIGTKQCISEELEKMAETISQWKNETR